MRRFVIPIVAAVLVIAAVITAAALVIAARTPEPLASGPAPDWTQQQGRASSSLAAVTGGPVRTGVNDFTFDSFDVVYRLGRDAEGHATLLTTETLVARFPDFDQNRGIRRS